MDIWQIISLDLPALLAAIFAAVSCALLGNFLLLQRLSLMGDAISHAVLPGIVIAFLISSSRATLPVFLGAAIAGILSAFLIDIIRRYGRVESGASMGVVFSIFFALGVLLIEQASARSIDLDADCLLHGQLESIFWSPAENWDTLLSVKTLSLLPAEVFTSFFTLIAVIFFIKLLYKELKIASFDPALATALGFNSSLLYGLLMAFVAASVVASFKVVGSILVIAMIICPAATARLYTDKLLTQILLSVLFALLACVVGYILGAFGPFWVGFNNSVNAAGMITVVSGAMLAAAVFSAPQYGILGRWWRNLSLRLKIREEDILAFLYRFSELVPRLAGARQLSSKEVELAIGQGWFSRLALRRVMQKGLAKGDDSSLTLSPAGEEQAKSLVRSHRLWESYLVKTLGLPPDHVHSTAEKLEHFTSPELQAEVSKSVEPLETDPHGRKIP